MTDPARRLSGQKQVTGCVVSLRERNASALPNRHLTLVSPDASRATGQDGALYLQTWNSTTPEPEPNRCMVCFSMSIR